MKEAFLQSIREEFPNEEVTRLVFADWCSENQPELEEKLRKHISPPDCFFVFPLFGDGFLDDFGEGYGDGTAAGDGVCHNIRNGHGDGFFKSESGDGSLTCVVGCCELKMPKLHRNQMIFLPDGLVFCGYVEEQIEPYVFKITNSSMVYYDNANLGWALVAKQARHSVRYRKYGTIRIGPQIFHSIDWEGDLP